MASRDPWELDCSRKNKSYLFVCKLSDYRTAVLLVTTERVKVERVRDLMNEAIPSCLVTNYEDLIKTISLPDLDGRHVFAATIRACAESILTFNLKDFPAAVLDIYNIQAQHTDDFLLLLVEQAPFRVCGALKKQREGLRNPHKSPKELLDILECQGLIQMVSQHRSYEDLL